MLLSIGAYAQDEEGRRGEDFVVLDPEGKKGFMFGVNIGYMLPNDDAARFYDGTPKEAGFLDLHLQIPFVRDQVFNELGPSVSAYQLVEYPLEMRYNDVLAIGGHLRYQFNWYSALVADVNFARLRAVDAFVLAYDDDNGSSQSIFQNFEILGEEDRLNLSMGYHVALADPGPGSMHFEFGPMLTSVRVRRNQISIGSRTYNILRAQTVGNGNQLLNNQIPTITSLGGYAQLGANLEFDKFTLDLAWRSSMEKVELYEGQEAKYRLHHFPFLRLVYRVTIKGF
jgi:hypothetical protein